MTELSRFVRLTEEDEVARSYVRSCTSLDELSAAAGMLGFALTPSELAMDTDNDDRHGGLPAVSPNHPAVFWEGVAGAIFPQTHLDEVREFLCASCSVPPKHMARMPDIVERALMKHPRLLTKHEKHALAVYEEANGQLKVTSLLDGAKQRTFIELKQRLMRSAARMLPECARLSGGFYYPPNAIMSWHTDQHQPGYRLYLTFADDGYLDSAFHVIMDERVERHLDIGYGARLFGGPGGSPNLWHCVVGGSRPRWSLGIWMSDARQLLSRLEAEEISNG